MSLTQFGKAVRKARLDAGVSLLVMAQELGLSSAFLSAIETGRKKVPNGFAHKLETFFEVRGVLVGGLQQLADVSNEMVSLEGLQPEHQMLVAGFARKSLDTLEEEDVEKLRKLFMKIGDT